MKRLLNLQTHIVNKVQRCFRSFNTIALSVACCAGLCIGTQCAHPIQADRAPEETVCAVKCTQGLSPHVSENASEEWLNYCCHLWLFKQTRWWLGGWVSRREITQATPSCPAPRVMHCPQPPCPKPREPVGQMLGKLAVLRGGNHLGSLPVLRSGITHTLNGALGSLCHWGLLQVTRELQQQLCFFQRYSVCVAKHIIT